MTSILVLGGARSGKSAFAQKAAEQAAETVAGAARPVLIATGQAFDDEMAERIARHQADRGESWTTVEAPLALAEAITALPADAVAVVDCLTLWLSNLMLDERDMATEATMLVEAVAACPARLWLVSNEVGLGLVPETPLGRRFRDEAGRLHQRLAQTVDEVYFVAAGLPLKLKPQG
ncbi:bifunctional adenosylcobinamide kinase/adenosylcobinamide-phosphate guanylyltransferase [Caulobacter sp. 602-1]|uniref:bifunctional adenosylcobinamide kinase/adenosylcobinamide-phosphate guanylyltransferase n=1 Tax=Caulobacter sp. 602-1 TaxID=2492472 RepID=UPI000F640339|nr:bifunctional adenosylcobinamide kinase/adenosylcobinamide-phosphate guanylyltransferase [Caulobacter sp. 602-1]RRN63072.1 bifunctional adenosylcobinamide kinase/adenosylcobinamide-phosphate guanylyltransferase [Caulobacter sp. 602-1]